MGSMQDNEEFLRLLDGHKKIIYKVCNSYCRHPESRKDLTQEIVIQLWKSFNKYDSQFKVSTWVYRIALNVAISFYRREKRHSESYSLTDNHLEVGETDSSRETEDNIAQLHQFIGQLDELNRALMILYLDDNSYKDISDVLGISETNVATKINRIKQKLKQQFETTKD